MRKNSSRLSPRTGAAVLLLALSAFPALLFGAEEKKEPAHSVMRELPGNTPYVHPSLEISFPPEIGSYRKTAVVENANPVYGTIVRYTGSRGESADIYLYSNDTGGALLEEKELLPEYEKTKIMLLKGKEKSSSLVPVKEEIRLAGEKVLRDWVGSLPAYRCDFQCSLGDERYNSTLILSLLEGPKSAYVREQEAKKKKVLYGKFVKIRISWSSEIASSTADAEEFLKALSFLLFPRSAPVSPVHADKKEKSTTSPAGEKRQEKVPGGH